jgi:hypothetical protein
MMKEEWRVHSTMFGSVSFALFPVLIFGIAFMGSFLLPLFRVALPSGNLALAAHANFLLLGMMVGAFGLLGNEVMNRRFGQASLLAYSARSLPLSEKHIFLVFVAKDTVYYFILWVFPFSLGFLVASPFIGIGIGLPLLLMFTLTLSFLTGLSGIFFLSTVYARSRYAVLGVLGVSIAGIAAFSAFTGSNPALLFPPVLLFRTFSWEILALFCAAVGALFGVSVLLFSAEYTGVAKRFGNDLAPLSQRLAFLPSPPLAAKDLIDLHRSGAAIGQTLFSFLIPLGVMWFFLSLLTRYLPPHGTLLMFAILTGVIASTMYTWLTAFDTLGAYACLPVGVRTLITSKITSFSLLQLIPSGFIGSVAVLAGDAAYAPPAIILCLSVSFYALGVTVWLTGLSPSVLVYDVKVLGTYLSLMGIALVIFSVLSFASPLYAFASVLLLIPGWGFVRMGYTKWEQREQPGF